MPRSSLNLGAEIQITERSQWMITRNTEAERQTIREDNKLLLRDFETLLKSSGLSKKVLGNHLLNIDFYLNEYLIYEEATEAKDGVDAVDMFLGYWFIKNPCGQARQASKAMQRASRSFTPLCMKRAS